MPDPSNISSGLQKTIFHYSGKGNPCDDRRKSLCDRIEIGLNSKFELLGCSGRRGAPSDQDRPYGMETNGNHSVFVKLQRSAVADAKTYEFSDVFSLLPRQNRLYDVLKILKRVGAIIH